jgi:uncharacterized protein YjiS (DUF1127 family)
MTTISLSATDALMDLMPGRAGPRKPYGGATAARPVGIPLRLRLLPRAWRDAMIHRTRQRELDSAFARLAETSPHLLADIGVTRTAATAEVAAPTWTRALPALGVPTPRRAEASRIRRPAWDAPSAWLR